MTSSGAIYIFFIRLLICFAFIQETQGADETVKHCSLIVTNE